MTTDRALVLFCVGAWCWVVVGAGHLAIVLVRSARAPGPAAAAVIAAMRGHPVRFLGLTRNLFAMHVGYSVAMGVLSICGGALSLLVTSTSSGAFRAHATSHASGMPPRGSPRTTTSSRPP